MVNLIARNEAREAGLTRYFDGKPCVNGHVCERITSSYCCSICHRDSKRHSKRKAYAANPERFQGLGRADYQRHPARYKLNASIRLGRIKNATPKWVTKEMLAPIYIERAAISTATGIPHDVDHIYPLKPMDGSFCGLNVPSNLQIMTSTMNRSKGNRWYGSRYSAKR